jgi:hypothetical protein
MTMSEQMAYWITEREAMRMRKESGRKPEWKHGWSDDPYMGKVRYCNVHREDDKVTRWLADNWRGEWNAPWQIVLARMVNYIPTLGALSDHWAFHDDVSIARATWRMKNLRSEGKKVWTSAYTISTCGQTIDKIDYVMGVVRSVEQAWQTPNVNTLAQWHSQLTTFKGLGSFLAAQVVADLKNTPHHLLTRAPDWRAWSAPGPGSLKGLSEYFQRNVTPATYQTHIAACWAEVKPLLPPELQDQHMQDFQNCLCEFSKFMRVRKGGHVRNKYQA